VSNKGTPFMITGIRSLASASTLRVGLQRRRRSGSRSRRPSHRPLAVDCPWPGLKSIPCLLTGVDVRARWCQPWVSYTRPARRQFTVKRWLTAASWLYAIEQTTQMLRSGLGVVACGLARSEGLEPPTF
jgi:hypothetical protein